MNSHVHKVVGSTKNEKLLIPHKKSISACLLTIDENENEVEHLREFERMHS